MQKEPIDLIMAKGKKHLTKDEYLDRKNSEVEVPFTEINPPKYLNKRQKEEFIEYAIKLKDINIFTELDSETLARYVISRDLYLKYTKNINSMIKKGNEEEQINKIVKIQNMQHKAFLQCDSCAKSLGLTVTSRCKLVIPQYNDGEDDEL